MNQDHHSPNEDYDDAALSSHYRALSREQPPRTLDKAIIRSARETIGKEAGKSLSRFASWWTPLATAASVLVVVALVRLLPDDQVHQLPAVSEELERTESESKAQRERAQGRVAPSSAPSRVLSNIASEVQPVNKKSNEAVRAKAKTEKDTIRSPALQSQRTAGNEIPRPSTSPHSLLRTPEQWIEHITALIAHNKIEEARSSFQQFAKRYPNHPQTAVLGARLKK